MLSDIFPTGWHSTRLADLKPGESIVIYGAGPVGLMAAMSARIQGASQIFVVDVEADRLHPGGSQVEPDGAHVVGPGRAHPGLAQ